MHVRVFNFKIKNIGTKAYKYKDLEHELLLEESLKVLFLFTGGVLKHALLPDLEAPLNVEGFKNAFGQCRDNITHEGVRPVRCATWFVAYKTQCCLCVTLWGCN